MDLQLITECGNIKYGGLSRYEKTLIEELKKRNLLEIKPVSQLKKSMAHVQLLYLFSDYFYNLAKKNTQTVTHFLNQQLALTLNFLPISNVVITVHDLAFIIPKYNQEFSCVEKIRYKLVLRGLRRAQHIITDAEFTKKEIIHYLNFPQEKISVIPLGVNLSIFKQKKLTKEQRKKYTCNNEGPVILYVGSEIKRMNVETLIKAFRELRKEIPNVKLIKIGSSNAGKERKKLLTLLHDLNLTGAVVFHDNVPDEELVNYYNTATVFVYPVEYTGYGLPCLEAMASGCPIITTTATTLPEIVGDAALLFNPDDIITLKNNMKTLITNTKIRNNLIKKGLERVKSYTWDVCAKKTFDVYTLFSKK